MNLDGYSLPFQSKQNLWTKSAISKTICVVLWFFVVVFWREMVVHYFLYAISSDDFINYSVNNCNEKEHACSNNMKWQAIEKSDNNSPIGLNIREIYGKFHLIPTELSIFLWALFVTAFKVTSQLRQSLSLLFSICSSLIWSLLYTLLEKHFRKKNLRLQHWSLRVFSGLSLQLRTCKLLHNCHYKINIILRTLWLVPSHVASGYVNTVSVFA